MKRGAKRRSAQLFFQRPFLGRWSTWLSAARGPQAIVRFARRFSLQRRPLITPTCSLYAALDAAGVSLLAAVSAGPDAEAFTAGLQIVLAAAFLVIVLLIGLSVIRKALDV